MSMFAADIQVSVNPPAQKKKPDNRHLASMFASDLQCLFNPPPHTPRRQQTLDKCLFASYVQCLFTHPTDFSLFILNSKMRTTTKWSL